MKDQAFNGKDSICIINVLTKFKRAWDFAQTHEGAAVWLIRGFMNGTVLVTINAPLILLWNDASRHGGTILSYAGMVGQPLRRYKTDNIIVREDEENRYFKQGSLMP